MSEQRTEQRNGQQAAATGKKPRGKPFTGGNDPRRWPNVQAREPEEEGAGSGGLPLAERMARVMTEELSDAELKKLLKDSPSDYRRLMELAQKSADSLRSADGGDGPRDADEARVRETIEELLAWSRDRAARQEGGGSG